jgi:dTDP-4-dehydrorhamnose reductase
MKIVVVGSNGRLGAALARELAAKFDIVAFGRSELDLENLSDIPRKIDKLDFDILINCAAYTNVDLCESQRDRAFLINAEAPRVMAEICRHQNAKLIHFSTDYVFDGEKREPYREDDAANPLSVYGESKRVGEENVLAVQDRHLVVRVSWVFGPDRPSFIDGVIKRAMETERVDAVADKFSTPTYTHDVAEWLPHVFAAEGILHLANDGECSWQEYAQHALDCCHSLGVQVKAKTVAPLKLADMKNFVARRPVYTVLSTEKFSALNGAKPRSWRDAVADYIRRSYSKT